MVTVYDVLRSDPLFFSLDSDGDAMLIATAYKEDIFALKAEIAGIDICGDIDSGEVSDMDGAVGVRESGRDKSSFEIH